MGQYVKGQSGNPTGQNHREPWRIKELAQQYTETAIETLVEIARSGSSESARVAAAVAILDRGWGKPAMQVQVEPKTPSYRVVRLPAQVKSVDEWFERYAPKEIVEARLKARESGSDTVSETLTQ
jgi:hypothetical protein